MKKSLYFIVFLLGVFKIHACDCPNPKSIIEFYTSKHVFEGIVISKIYDLDSLNYTVRFEILKHYKKGSNPQFLDFKFKSEDEFTGEYTSCDWNIIEGENWLIYSTENNDKSTFSNYCSNSRPIDNNKITSKEKKILNNGNEFRIENYILSDLDAPFTKTKPEQNIDSLLNKFKSNNYGDSYNQKRADIVVDIDLNGNLVVANVTSREHTKFDNINKDGLNFNLEKPINKKYRNELTAFENDMLNLMKSLKKWEPVYIYDTNVKINVRLFLQFHKSQDKIEAHY